MAEREVFVESNRKARKEIKKRLFGAATADRLIGRLTRRGIVISYDRPSDYLYISLGKRRESVSIGTDDSLQSLVLYDPATYEPLGFEVPFFLEKLSQVGTAGPFWTFVAELIQEHGDTVYVPAKDETERAERALYEQLILA
jgi:hypothetical protein